MFLQDVECLITLDNNGYKISTTGSKNVSKQAFLVNEIIVSETSYF